MVWQFSIWKTYPQMARIEQIIYRFFCVIREICGWIEIVMYNFFRRIHETA